ncbi:MAG: DUF4097 family beta strand repeat protein [bacterium]|nr:DUF4097 family beta strand repeat protein [bacterium]
MMTSLRLLPAYLVLTIFALLPVAGCAAGGNRYHADVHETIPLARPLSLAISQPAGRIRVVAWNEPRVQIDAVKSAGSAEDLARIEVAIENRGGAISVETRYRGIGFGNGGVDYTIHAPAATPLDVHTAAGQITLDGLRGDVHATTAAGQITATMAAVGGAQHVDLEAVTGEVVLAMPTTSDATIDASATIGSVRNAFDTARIGNGSANVHLRTTTGAIRIDKAP